MRGVKRKNSSQNVSANNKRKHVEYEIIVRKERIIHTCLKIAKKLFGHFSHRVHAKKYLEFAMKETNIKESSKVAEQYMCLLANTHKHLPNKFIDERPMDTFLKEIFNLKRTFFNLCLQMGYYSIKQKAILKHNTINFLLFAANEGDASNQCCLGKIYLMLGEQKKGYHWIHTAALQEEKVAQYNMGYICSKHKKPYKCYIWTKLSAENNYSLAQYSLAKMYSVGGDKIPKNHKLAIKWYNRAAKRGHKDAVNILDQFKITKCVQN